MSSRNRSTERLFVGNLPYDVTEREVDDLFYKFGRIREIEVKRSRKQDTSFAFVIFDDKYLLDYKWGRTSVEQSCRSQRGGERRGGRGGGEGGGYGPPRRYIIAEASWQDLKDHMRKAGDVGFASVENRVGVVEYPTREEMDYAIKRLDKSEFRNIFHRATIRVEPDYGSGGEDGYDRYARRSRSSSQRRDRSRSPRPNSSSHAERDGTARRSASQRSRASCPSPHAKERPPTEPCSSSAEAGADKSGSEEAVTRQAPSQTQTHARTHSRSRSRSRSHSHSPARSRSRSRPRTHSRSPSRSRSHTRSHARSRSCSRSRTRSVSPARRSASARREQPKRASESLARSKSASRSPSGVRTRRSRSPSPESRT